VNEERVKQLRDIEKQARELYEQAVRESQQLPQQAENEARQLLEQAGVEARAEAQRILSVAKEKSGDESILIQAKEDADKKEALATNNLERAVKYVLNRVAIRQG